MQEKNKKINRRDFLKRTAGAVGLVALASTPFAVFNRVKGAPDNPLATEGKPDNNASAKSKVRAWGMVIDLRKCDGCVTIGISPACTQTCINGHFAPKGQEWIQVYKAELPGGGSSFMPVPCFQCENAPCVNVCPVAATYHNEDGVVLVDHKRCIGCRFCMSACPYHRRFFNWGTVELPPEAAFAEYSPLYPVPAIKGTVIKCMFCAHFLHDGKLPFCVAGCPMKAIYMCDFNEDVASNGVEVVILSRFLRENNAYRYKEDLGTQPRVWYIPGHGEQFGRHANDTRELKPVNVPWGGATPDQRLGLWPWDKPDTWTWEANPK
ncbi:MAG: 4Fe-4S dicluster domain-containing protein [Dehalococcoidia bacterium]|nr:4Fe-4S dicluster domain-containing protein [Dehalococcoidia bacterium]